MFVDPQVNLFADEVEPCVTFYVEQLGFTETFRTPPTGEPDHVEMTLGGFVLGIAKRSAGRETHGLELVPGPPQCDLVLWCDDVDGAYQRLLAAGAGSVAPPHDFLDNRAAWITDPAGQLVSIVAKRR